MRNKTIYTFLLLLVFAVGANAQNGYQSAKEKVKIGGKNVIVKSEVYLNLMPQIIGDNSGGKSDCSKSGSLIAPVTIETANGAKLPKGIEIKRIRINNENFWQQIQFNKMETNVKEMSIYSVARTCPNNKFNAEKSIIVVVEFKYKGKSYFVRSAQTQLQKVY